MQTFNILYNELSPWVISVKASPALCPKFSCTIRRDPRHVQARFHGLQMESAAGSKKNNFMPCCRIKAWHYTALWGLDHSQSMKIFCLLLYFIFPLIMWENSDNMAHPLRLLAFLCSGVMPCELIYVVSNLYSVVLLFILFFSFCSVISGFSF